MIFSLVFEKSGDSIPVRALSPLTYKAVEYFVEHTKTLGADALKPTCMGEGEGQSINKHALAPLQASITDINTFSEVIIGSKIPVLSSKLDYLNPAVLNKLHADWVASQSLLYNVNDKLAQYGASKNKVYRDIVHRVRELMSDDITELTTDSVLSRLGLSERYGKINTSIHRLEEAFKRVSYESPRRVQFDNIFPKELITNDVVSVGFGFDHLGRTLCDKFTNHDTNLECDDENTYNQLVSRVILDFRTPETVPYSKEYTAWCATHNKVPSGRKFGVGRFISPAKNLTNYMQIVYRNNASNNALRIELHK